MVNVRVSVSLQLAVDDVVSTPLSIVHWIKDMPFTHHRLKPGGHEIGIHDVLLAAAAPNLIVGCSQVEI